MKKDVVLKVLYALTAAVVIFNLVINIKNGVFFDINELPEGELVYSVDSPDQKKTLNIYLIKNNLGAAVRGEISCKDKSSDRYNIFWQTDTDEVQSSWAGNDVVVINDVALDIYESTYDSRRGTSLFQEGAVEGKAAEDYKNRIMIENQ